MNHLQFVEVNTLKKTKHFHVIGYRDCVIGEVRWHGAWRQYCLFVEPECVWSHDCLAEASQFIKRLMDERRGK